MYFTKKQHVEDLSPQMLTCSEIATILRISRSFAYQLVSRKEIPSVRMGRAVRVRSEDLQSYIERSLASEK